MPQANADWLAAFHPTPFVSHVDGPVATLDGARYQPVTQPPARGVYPRAVLVPGAGGTFHAEGLDVLARMLAHAGIDTLVTNLPHNQQRGGPGSIDRNVKVFAQLVGNFVAEANPPDAPVSLIVGGKSYGSRVALHYAATHGLTSPTVRLAGVLAYGFPLHAPGKTQTRDTMFADIVVPGLFLQGSRDPFGSTEELAGALSRFGGNATLVAINGGNHDGAVAKKHAPDGVKHTPATALLAHHDAVRDWALAATATPG